MVIQSPVGRFPFKVTSFTVHGATISIRGTMGTWPTEISLPVTDIPGLLLIAAPAVVLPATLLGLVCLVARRYHRVRARATSHSTTS